MTALKFTLLSILSINISIIYSQDSYKQWNSTYNQWEWYNSRGVLIEFEKYDGVCNCYKRYRGCEYYQNGRKKYSSDCNDKIVVEDNFEQRLQNAYNHKLRIEKENTAGTILNRKFKEVAELSNDNFFYTLTTEEKNKIEDRMIVIGNDFNRLWGEFERAIKNETLHQYFNYFINELDSLKKRINIIKQEVR